MEIFDGLDLIPGQNYILDYTNYQGTRAKREITFIKFFWAEKIPFHSEKPGFAILATAKDRNNEQRYFAASGVHSVRKAATVQAKEQPDPAKKLRDDALERLANFMRILDPNQHGYVIADCQKMQSNLVHTAPEVFALMWDSNAKRVIYSIGERAELLAKWREIVGQPTVL